MRRARDGVAPVLEAAWAKSAYLCTPSSLVDDRAALVGAAVATEAAYQADPRRKTGLVSPWKDRERLELELEERTEFQTHESMFNEQADVGGKMSGVKRHDQVPESGQNQSD